MSKNPLLIDLEDERTAEAIEKGNLPAYKRAHKLVPKAEPSLITQWTSLGYFAHIDEMTCKACGSKHLNLVGVFLREHATHNPSTVRSTRLSIKAFRDLKIKPSLDVIPVPVDLCALCVDLV